jgi:hypothetical protein
MPIYEYVAEDGTRIEALRSMADADKPLADPEQKGRVFTRVVSAFAAKGTASGSGGGHVHTGMCGCGKRPGSCGGQGGG